MSKWWNKKCTLKKREARKALRDWRRGKVAENFYKKRKKWKKMRKEKKGTLVETRRRDNSNQEY